MTSDIVEVFSLTFDFVYHEILLKTFEHYGIRRSTLKWFHSYLSDRSQFVSINGHDSTKWKSPVVFQGSVLGPLLLLIFINDIYLMCQIRSRSIFLQMILIFT